MKTEYKTLLFDVRDNVATLRSTVPMQPLHQRRYGKGLDARRIAL